MGTVESIHIAAERRAMPDPVERVRATAGRGLEGDYHFKPHNPGAGKDLTLIAAEELEHLETHSGIRLAPGESRRQVTTRGIDLNALVGKRFRLGEIEAVGVELCEPCMVLARLTGQFAVLRGLAHRGGLRADVLTDGQIAVGDPVEAAGDC
jgi:MOSC domain-containing protein YiiM